MTTLGSQALRIPAYTTPRALAQYVLNGTESPELRAMQAALASQGLGDLADLVEGIRDHKERGSVLEERNDLTELLVDGVTRDESLVREALGRLARVQGGLRRFASAEEESAELVRALSVSKIGGALGTTTRSVDDRLAGPQWRKAILPEVLDQLLRRESTPGERATLELLEDRSPVENALLVLENRHRSNASQVVAFRVLLDHLGDVRTLRHYLTIFQAVIPLMGNDLPDPLLQTMATAVFQGLDGNKFFDRIGTAYQPAHRRVGFMALGGRMLILRPEELAYYRNDINTLKIEVLKLAPQRPSSENALTTLDWYSEIPSILSISGSSQRGRPFQKLSQVRAVFEDGNEPLWRRALALGYYAYYFYPDSRFYLPAREAEAATQSLLKILSSNPENHLLHRMAVTVYPRVVVNQIQRAMAENNAGEIKRVRAWALEKADKLSQAPSTVAAVKASKIRGAVESKLGREAPQQRQLSVVENLLHALRRR